MDKKSILLEVADQVRKNGLHRFGYTDGLECCCAVGYVMKSCGIPMTNFELDGRLNERRITVLPRYMDMRNVYDFFSIEELVELQAVNDRDYFTEDDRKNAVLDYIETLINKVEADGLTLS